MTARKTVSVSDLRIKVNAMIKASTDEMVETRLALATLLESVLHQTDNYRGFQYLASEYLSADEQKATGRVLRDGYDKSRRYYL